MANGEADLFMLGWMPDYGHPHNFLHDILCGNASFGPNDEVLCNELSAALAETDFQEQLASYQWASRRVHDSLPLVPIAHVQEAVIVRHNVIGVLPAAVFAASFKDVYFGSQIYLPLIARKYG